MPDRKVVLTEDAQRFASQMGIQLFETSAKDKNVEDMFNAITQQVLITKKEQKEQAGNMNDTITMPDRKVVLTEDAQRVAKTKNNLGLPALPIRPLADDRRDSPLLGQFPA